MALRYCKAGFDEENAGPIPIVFTDTQRHTAGVVEALSIAKSTDQQAWDAALHHLLNKLFFSIHPEIDRMSDKDPIAILLLLINLNRHHGTFPPCGIITACLAGLSHGIRLIAAKEIVALRKEDVRPDALVL